MATTSPARARKTAAAKDTSPPATKKATPRRATAKRAPAEKAPAKKTTTRTTAAQDPGKATKKATTTAARTKTAAAVKKTSAWPEFITHKMITAHYQACLHGLPTRNIRDWRELPTGIAAIHFPSGARLDHTPADDAPFHANTPCPQGVTHRHPVRTIADLKDAETIAKACTDWHGEAKPQHLSARLQVAKKSVAKTQSMSEQEIADGLAARAAADTETPKEHPQP